MLWISEATGRQSRLLEAAPAACSPALHSAPSPQSFRKRPREHPEADLQKASPTIWEDRGSGVQLRPFDLSSYFEPDLEAVALN